MRSTVATVGADRRGCFSFAPSVARARGADCEGWRGVAPSRRWTASGRGCAVSGGFIGRGVRGARNSRRLPARWGSRCAVSGREDAPFLATSSAVGCEVRGTCADCLRGGVHGVAASGREGAVSGDFIGRCGVRCAGLAPAACAVAFTVRRLRGGRTPFRVTSSAAVGRGARDLRRLPARRGSRWTASGRRGRRFGRLHRPWGVEVCGTCAGGRGIDVHRASGAGASVGVSVSQKRSRSNRSASSSSPPASARARAWSTS